MVYRRKRRTTKRRYKRRRSYKRSLNQAGARFILKEVDTINASAGVFTVDFNAAGVSTMPDWSALQALYDSFEVKAISVIIRPINVGDESGGTPHTRGNVGSIIDMDGGGLPTSMTTAYEYNSFKLHNARHAIKRYLPIPRKYRPNMNDISVGYNSNNNNSTIRILGDNFSNSSQYWYMVKYYVTCYGRR